MPFGADVGERDAVVLVLGGGLGIGPGVAGDAAEIGKERAALREERRVERFGLGRFALRHEICREVRRALVDLAVATLGPIGDEMRRLTADTAYVDAILKRGADRAGEIGARHMNEVKDIMGLLRP